MTSKSLIRIGALCALASAASAQSFNIDIHMSPSMTPPSTDGGFAGVTGAWNAVVPSTTPQALVRLDGTTVDNSTIFFTPPPATGLQTISPPHDRLYEDFASGDNVITITNLDAGNYALVVYSFLPDCSTYFDVDIDGAGPSIVINPTSFPGYVPLVSLAQFSFTATQGQSVNITMLGDPCSVVNGMQLVHYVGTQGCPQAIPNSIGYTPQVVGTGTIINGGISVAANDLKLHVGLIPDSSLSTVTPAILAWVSNDESASAMAPCPDVGKRCIGAFNITRVLDPNGAGGVGTPVNGTYQVSVDFVAIAAAGIDTTPTPGKKLYFQMFYRDVDYYDPDMDGIGECDTVGTGLKRWTQSVAIPIVP